MTDRLGNLSSGSNLRASGAEVVDWSFPSRGRALRRPGYYDARPPPPRLAAILLLIRTQWAEPGAGPSGRCGAAAAGLSHCAACQGAGRSLEAREPSSRGEPRALAAQAGPVSARSRAAGPAERRRARTGAVRRGWAAAERTARPPCGVAGAARRRRGGRRGASSGRSSGLPAPQRWRGAAAGLVPSGGRVLLPGGKHTYLLRGCRSCEWSERWVPRPDRKGGSGRGPAGRRPGPVIPGPGPHPASARRAAPGRRLLLPRRLG